MKLNVTKVMSEIANLCLNYSDFSIASGIPRETLSRMLSGKHKPRVDTIGKLAKALGKSVEEITLN